MLTEKPYITKNIRISLTEQQWRELRVMAATQDNSVSTQASLAIAVVLTQAATAAKPRRSTTR